MTQEAPDSQADVYGRRLCNRYSSQRSRSQSREALEEEHMVLNEIEHVLHEAAKRLFQERELVRRIPIPMKKPEELLVATCPAPSGWGISFPILITGPTGCQMAGRLPAGEGGSPG